MPRRIDPRFDTDEMVMLALEESPSAEEVDRVLNCLSGEFDRPKAAGELAALADEYLRWRRQARSDVSQSQCNEQIRQISIASEALGRQPEAAARVRTLIRGLSGEAYLALCATPPLCLRDDDDPWCIEALAANLPAVAQAARNGVRPRPGPKPDITLAISVSQLLDLFEAVTGLRATHTPYAGDEYKQAPQSEAGRFAHAFFQAIDPCVRGEQISTVLAREIKERLSRTPVRERTC